MVERVATGAHRRSDGFAPGYLFYRACDGDFHHIVAAWSMYGDEAQASQDGEEREDGGQQPPRRSCR